MNWTLALPEIVLALCGLGIMVFGVARRPEPTRACTMLVAGALLLAGALCLANGRGVAYGGLLVADPFATFAQLLILLGALLAVLLSLDYNGPHRIARFEFPLLVLFSTVGMLVMAASSNLMTLYLGLELQSLPVYVLCAFARDDVRSSEAGLKYFVLSALASGLLLYGISFAYGFAGSMDYGAIARAMTSPQGASPGLVVGIVFIIAGLAFKLSAAPFHMWTPDVYEGAPTPVTAFLSTAPKVAPFAVLLRVMVVPFAHVLPQWQLLIELIAVASMLLGSLAAIGQVRIKRLMAYSSIGHMGYAMVGLAAGNAAGVRGVLIYLVAYVFMSGGVFACIVAMRRRGRALERVDDLAGLSRTDPMLALLLAVLMLGMAGIPPLSGFFGKLYVFLAAVQAGLYWLAVVGLLTSVIGAFYYLRVIRVMYFDAAAERFDARGPVLTALAVVGGAVTVLFLLFLAPIAGAAQAAAQVLLG